MPELTAAERRAQELAAIKRHAKEVGFPDIMGAAEVADALGVAVQNLQYIKDLPIAVGSPRASRIWLDKEITKFAKVYQARRPQRDAA